MCVSNTALILILKSGFHDIKKITFRMETRYSRTLVLLPRLSPIGKIVHLIGDNFKPFFLTNWETFSRGNGQISEVIKGKQYHWQY
jgi:hypothetical protein